MGVILRAGAASLIAAVSMRLDILGDLLWLFLLSVALDYLTGIAAAVYTKKLSSGTGLRGIVKKTSLCFVIAAALLTDDLISKTASQFGHPFSTGNLIAVAVTTWLTINELISILENIDKMNIPLPPFLLAALRRLKTHTEKRSESLTADK
ncbi:MAG: phage holin family protein [Oscillospiraceae bacterium]|nr:phage holin family protein [Oscillospiraceae bacterium]